MQLVSTVGPDSALHAHASDKPFELWWLIQLLLACVYSSICCCCHHAAGEIAVLHADKLNQPPGTAAAYQCPFVSRCLKDAAVLPAGHHQHIISCCTCVQQAVFVQTVTARCPWHEHMRELCCCTS